MIYLDNAATTKPDKDVLSAMWAVLSDNFGNSHSPHQIGRAAGEALLSARDSVAEVFGCSGGEVYFLSGGTEANNLAVKGVCAAKGKGHLIISAIEHPSIIESAIFLQKRGYDVTFIPPDEGGFIRPADVEAAIKKDTVFCAVQAANSELGTIQPIEKIGEICTRHGVFYYCDFVQAVGAIPFPTAFASAFCVSAHKFHGPKGSAAMFLKKGSPITPLISGGTQEGGLRGGTVNVAGAVGLAVALKNAASGQNNAYIASLRDRFLDIVLSEMPCAVLNGGYPRVPSNANISFDGLDGQSIVFRLDMSGVCASTGTACSAGAVKSSAAVTAALGAERAKSAVRFTFSKNNTLKEAESAATILTAIIRRLKSE